MGHDSPDSGLASVASKALKDEMSQNQNTCQAMLPSLGAPTCAQLRSCQTIVAEASYWKDCRRCSSMCTGVLTAEMALAVCAKTVNDTHMLTYRVDFQTTEVWVASLVFQIVCRTVPKRSWLLIRACIKPPISELSNLMNVTTLRNSARSVTKSLRTTSGGRTTSTMPGMTSPVCMRMYWTWSRQGPGVTRTASSRKKPQSTVPCSS
jgi:hypothetical protein